jgi:hypothetical protein
MVKTKKFLGSGSNQRLVFLALMILLIGFRAPELLLDPRFWAEEGALYFGNAHRSPSWVDFFSPELGYYSLYVKMSVYLALVVPIENAPLVTTLSALLAMVACLYFVLVSDNLFLQVELHRFFFGLFLILISTGEIWLNTLTLQFWFPIGALFIFIDRQVAGFIAMWFRLIFVAVAALTGVMTFFLLPLLSFQVRKAVGEEKLQKQRYMVCLVAGLLIQLGLIAALGFGFEAAYEEMQGGARLSSEHSFFDSLKSLVGYYILYPIIGLAIYDTSLPAYYVLAAMVMLGFLVLLFTINWTRESAMIVLTAAGIAIGTLVLSVGTQGGLRYAFVSNALITLVLMHSVINGVARFAYAKFLATLLLVLASFVAVLEYKYKMRPFVDDSWASWKQQVSDGVCAPNPILVWPSEPFAWSVSGIKCRQSTASKGNSAT